MAARNLEQLKVRVHGVAMPLGMLLLTSFLQQSSVTIVKGSAMFKLTVQLCA